MKRKRLEAWAKTSRNGEQWGHSHSREVLERNFDSPSDNEYPTVRLVECGPDEAVMPKAAAAVVRAAVKLARKGVSNLFPEGRAFNRAVERMKGGRE